MPFWGPQMPTYNRIPVSRECEPEDFGVVTGYSPPVKVKSFEERRAVGHSERDPRTRR